MLGMIGAAMFYGDIRHHAGDLGPFGGRRSQDRDAEFEPYVVPLTVVILVGLFAVQRRGTANVAAFFGPIMVVVVPRGRGGRRCCTSATIRAYSRRSTRTTRSTFLAAHGIIGLVTLGAVFLAVTGGEALYADLGHFGRRPIQTAWFGLVLPALVINYFGQGALVLVRSGSDRQSVLSARPGDAAAADGRAGDRARP